MSPIVYKKDARRAWFRRERTSMLLFELVLATTSAVTVGLLIGPGGGPNLRAASLAICLIFLPLELSRQLGWDFLSTVRGLLSRVPTGADYASLQAAVAAMEGALSSHAASMALQAERAESLDQNLRGAQLFAAKQADSMHEFAGALNRLSEQLALTPQLHQRETESSDRVRWLRERALVEAELGRSLAVLNDFASAVDHFRRALSLLESIE